MTNTNPIFITEIKITLFILQNNAVNTNGEPFAEQLL